MGRGWLAHRARLDIAGHRSPRLAAPESRAVEWRAQRACGIFQPLSHRCDPSGGRGDVPNMKFGKYLLGSMREEWRSQYD